MDFEHVSKRTRAGLGRFRSFADRLQLVSGRVRSFQVVSGCFSSFQVVSGRSRLFQLVSGRFNFYQLRLSKASSQDPTANITPENPRNSSNKHSSYFRKALYLDFRIVSIDVFITQTFTNPSLIGVAWSAIILD